MGMDPAEARRYRMGGTLADGLARPGRAVRRVAVLPVAGPRRVARRRAARAPGDAAEQAAERRPRDVLLPVPGAGGPVLRRPAVPLGLPGALGTRDRRPVASAVPHAPDRRDRDPEALPGRLAAARRAERPAGPVRGHGRAARRA